jgi:hypothetical protein
LMSIVSSFAPIFILLLILMILVVLICLYIYKSKPYLFTDVSYKFTHWGIVRIGERTEFSKPWRDISEFRETKAFFLLCIGSNDFHIIQKSMFHSLEDINDFRCILKEHIRQ